MYIYPIAIPSSSQDQQKAFTKLVDQILAAKKADPDANVSTVEAERTDPFEWVADRQTDESLMAVEEKGLRFVLSLRRNPFEIRLH